MDKKLVVRDLLFIGFIDDLVEYLETRCEPEPFIDMLHCLLHADDTTILSTNRDLFIVKCNAMLDYFTDNELKLNLSKSASQPTLQNRLVGLSLKSQLTKTYKTDWWV